jgi:hypothetical protein
VEEMPDVSRGSERTPIESAIPQANLDPNEYQAGRQPKSSASLSDRNAPASLDVYGIPFDNIVRVDYTNSDRSVPDIAQSDSATIQWRDPRTGSLSVSDVYRTPQKGSFPELRPDGTEQQTYFTYSSRTLKLATGDLSYRIVDGGRALPDNCIYTRYLRVNGFHVLDSGDGSTRYVPVDGSVRPLDGSRRTVYGIAGSDKVITRFDKQPEHIEDSAELRAIFDEWKPGDGSKSPYVFLERGDPGQTHRRMEMVPLTSALKTRNASGDQVEGKPGDLLAKGEDGNFEIVTKRELAQRYSTGFDLNSKAYLNQAQRQLAEADPSAADCFGGNLRDRFRRIDQFSKRKLQTGLPSIQASEAKAPKIEPLIRVSIHGDRFSINEDGTGKPPYEMSPEEVKAEIERAVEKDPSKRGAADRANRVIDLGTREEKCELIKKFTEQKAKGVAILTLLTLALGAGAQNAAEADTQRAD